MSELPYMPVLVEDAMADRQDLTNEQLGAYERIRLALWRAGGYLPLESLPLIACAGRRWGKIKKAVLAKLTVIDETASCAAVLKQLDVSRSRRRTAAVKAAKASNARWGSKTPFVAATAGLSESPKPLKTNGPMMLEALIMQSMRSPNQNLKIESKSLSKRDEEGGAVYGVGIKLLTERVGIKALAARTQVAKWLVLARDDAALLELFEAVAYENLQRAHLVAVIDQRLRTMKSERERGKPLPLGFTPNVVSKSS